VLQSQSGFFEENKNLCSCRVSNYDISLTQLMAQSLDGQRYSGSRPLVEAERYGLVLSGVAENV
jgi:hypothetical protein